MLLTTLQIAPGKRIVEHYGVVTGSTVRAKHVGSDFIAGLRGNSSQIPFLAGFEIWMAWRSDASIADVSFGLSGIRVK